MTNESFREIVTKVCASCKKELSIESFRVLTTARDVGRYRHMCRDCERIYSREYAEQHEEEQFDSNLKRKYGITSVDYEVLFTIQKGLCAICRKPEKRRGSGGKVGLRGPKTDKIRRLAVDHDHTTGQVRGLVCHDCNVTMGFLDESPERIGQILHYMTSFLNTDDSDVISRVVTYMKSIAVEAV